MAQPDKKTGEKRGRGRPSSFRPEFVAQAKKLAKMGATDQEMADFFEVDRATFYRWQHENTDLRDALKLGKEACDARVERSLFERAMGYEHDEVDIRVVGGKIIQTPIRKFYPPETTACIFWLKNRQPKEWRDKQEVEHSGGVTVHIAAKDAALL